MTVRHLWPSMLQLTSLKRAVMSGICFGLFIKRIPLSSREGSRRRRKVALLVPTGSLELGKRDTHPRARRLRLAPPASLEVGTRGHYPRRQLV